MEFLGIGPLELLFVALLAIIFLGPRDLARIARSSGKFLNKVYRSEMWSTLTRASRDIRNLPNRLAREAALEELDETIRTAVTPGEAKANQALADELDAWRPSDGPTNDGPPREAESLEIDDEADES